MTANIALSCLGVVFTLAWLWWVCYSVKTLRKFEKTTQNGEEVMIVREKVWQKSMARLLRRDEDDDVNGIKRIVTGGLIDLVEMESRRGSVSRARSRRGGGFAVGATTPRPSHESSRTSISGGRSHAGRTTPLDTERPPYERSANDGVRADVAPPPYIGQPANEGTNTTTSSSGGTGTFTTTTTSMSMSMSNPTSNSNDSPHSDQLARSGTIASTTSRPLPLAPPQIERVVERKMDEMAGSGGNGTMDAYTATRLGLGPVVGTEGRTMENIVDQKMDSFNRSQSNTVPVPSGDTGGGGTRETMEQLVDRKITFAGVSDTPGPSTSASIPTSRDPYSNHPLPATPTPLPRFPPRIHASSYNTYKGKAAEAGFTIQNQNQYPNSPTTYTDSPVNTLSTTESRSGEMSLEEMIELKMASLRARSKAQENSTHRPVAVETHS